MKGSGFLGLGVTSSTAEETQSLSNLVHASPYATTTVTNLKSSHIILKTSSADPVETTLEIWGLSELVHWRTASRTNLQ